MATTIVCHDNRKQDECHREGQTSIDQTVMVHDLGRAGDLGRNDKVQDTPMARGIAGGRDLPPARVLIMPIPRA